MRKSFLFLVIIAAVGITSCKKKGCTDATAVNYSESAKKDDGSCAFKPIITLNGSSTVTINVGDTYTDAGATAKNKDGSSVTVTSNATDVDPSTAGVYMVTYSATNANGTTTATRTVNVVIGQDNWVGEWVLTHDCATSFPLNSTPSITVGASTNEITLDGMFSISIPSIPLILPDGLVIAEDGTANASVNGSQITMSSQVYDVMGVGSITYSGTGSMNSTGTQFTVNYTYTNSLPGIGGSGTCTAIYTKQ
jgi:hypothetical protein